MEQIRYEKGILSFRSGKANREVMLETARRAWSVGGEEEDQAGMSVEERIHAALTMDRRYSWLKPAPKED